MQRCHRHGGPAEGQQGVPARVCHTRFQVPAALLADHRHGRQRSSASMPAPRTEARCPPSRTWGPGAPGQWLKSRGHQPLRGSPHPAGLDSAWAHGQPTPSLQPCQAPPRTDAGHLPTWPPWLGTRTRRLQGGQCGRVPASTGRDSRTSPSREPRGGCPQAPSMGRNKANSGVRVSRRLQPAPMA